MNIVLVVLLVSAIGLTSCQPENTAEPEFEPEAPSAPSLIAPDDGAIDEPLLTALAWGRCEGATAYLYQISLHLDFSDTLYSNMYPLPDTMVTLGHLEGTTRYFWRVRAQYPDGLSEWSPVRSFTTMERPEGPRLISPDDGDTVSTAPLLLWGAAPRAAGYLLELSSDSIFTLIIARKDIRSTDTSHRAEDLPFSSAIFWRVRAASDAGLSGWSSTGFFRTVDQPAGPALISPGDGSLQTVSPVLHWGRSPEADGYFLELSASGAFAVILYGNPVPLTDTSHQVDDLPAATTIYWRVRSTTAVGLSRWSPTWRFTTEQVKAVCPAPSVNYAGMTYRTVPIGDQCWLEKNLDAGVRITSPGGRDDGRIEKYCHQDDSLNCRLYGGLYTWNEAMQYSVTPGSRGICPAGWHIPTSAEYRTLLVTVNQSPEALISAPFAALLWETVTRPCYDCVFRDSMTISTSYFWSSTMTGSYPDILRISDNDVRGAGVELLPAETHSGYSVRCIAD